MSKDPSFDRLLERTLAARAEPPRQAACLDAETLAAWADGSLTAVQRTAAETHAADCDRCLAVVAAIAKTSPPPSATTQRPAWLTVRWLAPLTAAAVAITTWAVVQGPFSPQPAPPAAPAEAIDQLRSMARAERGPRIIVSPDPDVRWHLSGPSVERSADGGRTWQRQPTSTSLELLAGSSPAPTVCWIVGRSGLVLLSTDGNTWRRLEFPGPAVDLVAVTATTGEAATVTTADGRTYQTADGGRTWILQESPATSF